MNVHSHNIWPALGAQETMGACLLPIKTSKLTMIDLGVPAAIIPSMKIWDGLAYCHLQDHPRATV